MSIATRSWLEINLAAIENNARIISAQAAGRAWLAVVKADGYGYGSVAVAKAALAGGAHMLAVASLEEGLALREAGIRKPILLLGRCPSKYLQLAVQAQLTLSIFDIAEIAAFEAVLPTGSILPVHLKIDTGMGRMGTLAQQAMGAIYRLRESRHLKAEGIYTHLAAAGEDDEFTAAQISCFEQIVAKAIEQGMQFEYIHAANSAGFLGGVGLTGNLLRVGIALYGLEPTPNVPLGQKFYPALSWKTTIAQVKSIPTGHSVGYGRTYVATSKQRIAILPVGYADGYRRAPMVAQYVLVGANACPIIGRVSMEKMTIRLPDSLHVETEEEVVLLGQQGSAEIRVEQLADWVGTINYEVVTTISANLPRVYINRSTGGANLPG